MKLLFESKLIVPLLALGLVGCASAPTPPDSSTSHPGNAQADQGAVPPPPAMLMSLTNMVMIKPVTEPAPEHQHGHGAHEAKPKMEEKK